MPVTGPNGGDGTQAITAAVEDAAKQVTRDAMTKWQTAATERVMEAAAGRSGLDSQRDQRGSLSGRDSNALDQLGKAITAPVWNDNEGYWEFACAHAAAKYHEWGALPHEINADGADALAFEWEDAPDEVVAMFSPGGSDEVNRSEWDGWVYFESVEHPGTPAIGFMRHGREQARQYLEDEGYDTSEFATPGGEES